VSLFDEAALEDRMRRIARDEVRAQRTDAGEDWIDQTRSPLGRELHCALVRDGILPGCKVHRRVLVRRRDLDGYIESHPVTPRAANDVTTSSEARALARVGGRRVAS
jgi:hypothetical protein